MNLKAGAEACGLLKAYHKEDGTRLATALRAALAEQEKTDDHRTSTRRLPDARGHEPT